MKKPGVYKEISENQINANSLKMFSDLLSAAVKAIEELNQELSNPNLDPALKDEYASYLKDAQDAAESFHRISAKLLGQIKL